MGTSKTVTSNSKLNNIEKKWSYFFILWLNFAKKCQEKYYFVPFEYLIDWFFIHKVWIWKTFCRLICYNNSK